MILTQDEYNQQKDALLRRFATAQQHRMHCRLWRISGRKSNPVTARLLWLFVYALNTWDHRDGAYNHISERDIQLIFQQSNTL